MGQSTDAILCWGVDLGADYEPPWAELAEELGYDDPFEGGAIVHILTDEKIDPLEVDYKLTEMCIKVVEHCHSDYPMYILAAAGSITEANRGYPEMIPPHKLEVTEFQKALFLESLSKLGVKAHAKPAWILCSYWY